MFDTKKRLGVENKNIILFTIGKAISLFGTSIFTFAMGIYLLRTTGSGMTFAINIILYTLPLVFASPIAGVIADKIDKRKVVVGSDLLNGLFILLIYLFVIKNGINVLIIYFSTFIMTILSVFFNISIESAKPRLVTDKKLVKLNSIARVIESGSMILGPVLGGLIYAFIDIKLFILANSVSFIIAAIVEYFINYEFNKTSDIEKNNNDTGTNFIEDIKEGYSYIYKNKELKSLIYIFMILNFFISFSITVPLPYLLNTIWRVNPSIYGIVEGGFPVGMLIGALFANKVIEKIRYSELLNKINFASGFIAILSGIPLIILQSKPSDFFILVYYVILMFLGGIIVSWVDIPLNVIIQRLVPGNILGRVLSVLMSIVKIIVPIALLLSGYLLNYISPAIVFFAGAFLIISFNIIFFNSLRFNKLDSISYSDLVDVKN